METVKLSSRQLQYCISIQSSSLRPSLPPPPAPLTYPGVGWSRRGGVGWAATYPDLDTTSSPFFLLLLKPRCPFRAASVAFVFNSSCVQITVVSEQQPWKISAEISGLALLLVRRAGVLSLLAIHHWVKHHHGANHIPTPPSSTRRSMWISTHHSIHAGLCRSAFG